MEDWRELENYLARVSKDRIIAAVAEAASADGSNGISQKDWPYARAYYPVSCQTSQMSLFNCLASMSRAYPIRDNGLAENEKVAKGKPLPCGSRSSLLKYSCGTRHESEQTQTGWQRCIGLGLGHSGEQSVAVPGCWARRTPTHQISGQLLHPFVISCQRDNTARFPSGAFAICSDVA